MIRKIYTLFLILGLCQYTYSQRFESAQFLDSYTAAEITTLLGTPVSYGVDLYKVRYFTPNLEGEDHIASGLICIPQAENTSFPLVCYQHGTVNSRFDVPSELAGGYQLGLALSAFGYVVCAADFVGLGDSPGIHPYVHADTEASAGVDLLLAAREMSEDEDYPPFFINDQLFIGGYSQGGHASMAAHRLIESSYAGTFNVSAAAHMSGPYSISEKMLEFTLGDQEYGTVSYLAWLVLAYKAAYPESLDAFTLEDVFKAEYLADINLFADEDITLSELNGRLTDKLINNAGGVFPRELLKEDILNAILTDPTHPLSMALADNDTYDWRPEAPTNLYYCEGDEQVTFENAILAESVMQANGSTTVSARHMDPGFPLSHTQCISPVLTSVVFFFGSLQDISTSTSLVLAHSEIKTYSGADQLISEVPVEIDASLRMQIYDMSGRCVMDRVVANGLTVHDISNLTPGMYVVNMIGSQGIVHVNRFVKP